MTWHGIPTPHIIINIHIGYAFRYIRECNTPCNHTSCLIISSCTFAYRPIFTRCVYRPISFVRIPFVIGNRNGILYRRWRNRIHIVICYLCIHSCSVHAISTIRKYICIKFSICQKITCTIAQYRSCCFRNIQNTSCCPKELF